jgi:hypothetical protein
MVYSSCNSCDIQKIGPIRVQYRPLSWTHLEPHTEEVEQFLAMLKFEQKHQVKKLSEVLK